MIESKSYRNKRVLITGGAGFLGSHLCDFYLSDNWEVICMDNLSTGTTDNIGHLFGNENFKFIKHDVTNYIHLEGHLDLVLHFASPASPKDYLDMPIQTMKVGSLGTHKVLGLAKAKSAKFLLASTSEVYGDPLIHPQTEEYWGNVNPIGYRGVYDEAKRFAEALTMAYHRFHGLNTKIIRIFNTYGSRMRLYDGRALPSFFRQAFTDQPITVYGKGDQTRSFTYIDDLVDGIARLAESDFNEPINIGNPEEITILELAEEIIKITNSKSKIIFCDLPSDDPKIRKPDISRAQKHLNWNPRVNRHKGLEITMDYFKKRIATLNSVTVE